MSAKVQWLTPTPLWNELAAATDKAAFRRPTLLRFASDDFMGELERLLKDDPARLRSRIARPENWREPKVGLGAAGTLSVSTAQSPLRLYQPVHLRYYLVSAALTCRLPGLPDRTVRPQDEERVTFVVRRVRATGNGGSVFDPARRTEAAWVGEGALARWQEGVAANPVDAEERLPLFPMNYAFGGRTRRLFAGLVPASRREQYAGGRDQVPVLAATTADAITPRLLQFQRSVLDPWVSLVEWYDGTNASAEKNDASEQASPYILADFGTFLQTYLPSLAPSILGNGTPPASGPRKTLYDKLGATIETRSHVQMALRAAIKEAFAISSQLDALGASDPLPSNYPRTLLTFNGTALRDLLAPSVTPTPDNPRPARKLHEYVRAALEVEPPVSSTPEEGVITEPQRPPATQPSNQQGSDFYILRCIYERPRCAQRSAPVVSEPSEPFQLVAFFDPDAPARPLNVALPIDTSPAALRKYDRNVAMVLSDELRKQLGRIKNMRQLVDGESDSPQVSFSVICSFSIPIITICAFILLMIMVSLLNIIFRWIPFFIMCLPIPNLKAKA